jgi:putative ABC transport system permease protein
MISAELSRFRLVNAREMWSHKGRTFTSMAVIAVAAALLVAIAGIYQSVTGSVAALAQSVGGDADFEVTAVADSGMPENLVDALRHLPGVKTVAPLLRYSIGVGDNRMLVIGVDAGIEELHSDLSRAIQAQLSRGQPLTGVIAGPGLGYAVGDSIQIGGVTQKVSLVADGDAARRVNDGRFVVTLVGIAQRLTKRPHLVDSIFIVANPGTALGSLHDELAAAMHGQAVVAVPEFRSVQTSNGMALPRYATLLVGAIALVVSGFLVFNSMNMTATQRRPRIASLLALGGEPWAIGRDLLVEAGLLGAVGALVGIPIGVLAGMWAVDRLPPFLMQSIDARADYVLPTWILPLVLVATVGTTVLASSVAVRGVFQVSAIEAMAPRDVGTIDKGRQRFRRTARLLGLACMLAAGVLTAAVHDQNAIAAAALCAIGGLALAYTSQHWLVTGAVKFANLLGASGALAATVIERAPRRAWATAMTIALVVAVGTATSGAFNNMVDAATDTNASLANADLYVSATTKDMIPAGPILPSELAGKIERISGVARVVPVQYAYANLGAVRVLMEGADPRSATPSFHAMSPDVRQRVARGEGVVISHQLARTLRLTVGQTLQIPSASGIHTMPVLQIIDYVTMDSGLVALSLQVMQQWLQRDGATYLEIAFSPDAGQALVSDAVRRLVPTGLNVYSGTTALAATRGIVAQLGILAVVTQWIVAVIGAVAVLNTLMLSVLHRRRELGVIRALGASRAATARTVLAEAISLGLIGGLIGVVFGELLHYLGTVVIGYATSIHVAYGLSIMTPLYVFAAVAVCVAGSYPPARHAARLNMVDAISDE